MRVELEWKPCCECGRPSILFTKDRNTGWCSALCIKCTVDKAQELVDFVFTEPTASSEGESITPFKRK